MFQQMDANILYDIVKRMSDEELNDALKGVLNNFDVFMEVRPTEMMFFKVIETIIRQEMGKRGRKSDK